MTISGLKHAILLYLSIFPCLLIAQWRQGPQRLEAGIMVGMMGYSGDLTAKRVDWAELRPAGGAFVRYHLSEYLALRAHVYGGAISGDDKHSAERAARSLRFGSAIFELAVNGEWYPFGHIRLGRTGAFFIAPYASAGVGLTFADADVLYYGPPERRHDFLKVSLPEPGLKTRFVVAQAGGGVCLRLDEHFLAGLEGGLRPVFSDDIDGVSQNGNPASNDWYYYLGATLVFVF